MTGREGHLRAVSKLLSLFAASGHINYTKSGILYIQQIRELPEKHPWLYKQLSDGHHATRRSCKYWGGFYALRKFSCYLWNHKGALREVVA